MNEYISINISKIKEKINKWCDNYSRFSEVAMYGNTRHYDINLLRKKSNYSINETIINLFPDVIGTPS